ncbi:restriction endonuclease subunit S, partial [Escherichia coli]
KRAYCLKIQPATGSFARNLIYSTKPGKGPKYSENGTVRVVSQKCVQWSGFKLEQSRWITDESIPSYTEERFLKNGDVLWNSTGAGGTAGRVNFLETVKERLVVDSHVTIIRSIKQNGQFICNYISTYGIQQLFDPKHPKTLLSGTTNQAELNTSVVISFITPFPPQKEQERINTKVIELMSLCDQLEQQSLSSLDAHQQLVETLLGTLTDSQNAEELAENWARINEHFDTLFTTEASVDALKQTILQLAVMGKLVPQDPNDEPASELLKRIAQEKAQLVKEGKIKKQKPLPPISDEEKPFELPEGWFFCRMDDLCSAITSGSTPSKEIFSTDEGIPYLKVYNIRNQQIDFKYQPQFIQRQYHFEKMQRSILYPGDVIMNIVGPPLGKIAIIPDHYPEWNCNQAIVLFRLIKKDLNKYVYNYLLSGVFLDFIELIGTAGQDNISIAKSKNIVIPLAPVNEQNRIVEKLTEIINITAKLKHKINITKQTQLHLADALTDAAKN